MLLDTCVLIEHFRGNSTVSIFLARNSQHLSISSVTDMEIMQGIRNKKELVIYEELLQSLHINLIEINETISLTARRWVREYGLSHNLRLADALIAATAFHTKIKVVTFNVKDFRFLNIDVFSPK